MDPDGEFVTQALGAVFGAGFEIISQIGTQMAINGGDFSKVNIEWVDVGTMTVVGAVTSGLGVTSGQALKGAKKDIAIIGATQAGIAIGKKILKDTVNDSDFTNRNPQ